MATESISRAKHPAKAAPYKWIAIGIIVVIIIIAVAYVLVSNSANVANKEAPSIDTSYFSNTNSQTISTTSAGDIIFVSSGSCGGCGDSVTGVSDSAGLTWHQLMNGVCGPNLNVWYAEAPNILTNDVLTFTTSGGNGISIFTVKGSNGVVNKGSYSNGCSGGYSNVIPTITYTTTSSNNLLLTVLSYSGSSQITGANDGWTMINEGSLSGQNVLGTSDVASFYQTASTSGTYIFTPTMSAQSGGIIIIDLTT